MSGTLEMLKETWYTGDTPTQSIVEWVDELGKRLMAIWEVAEEREKVAKEKYYDRNAKRDFDEGSLFLVRTPDLQGKLKGPMKFRRK